MDVVSRELPATEVDAGNVIQSSPAALELSASTHVPMHYVKNGPGGGPSVHAVTSPLEKDHRPIFSSLHSSSPSIQQPLRRFVQSLVVGLCLFLLAGLLVFLSIHLSTPRAACHSIKRIQQRLIFTPPIFKEERSKEKAPAEQYPIGEGFVAANLHGRAILWGGMQVQMPTDHRDVLPKNVVYSYTPDERDGKWETMIII